MMPGLPMPGRLIPTTVANIHCLGVALPLLVRCQCPGNISRPRVILTAPKSMYALHRRCSNSSCSHLQVESLRLLL